MTGKYCEILLEPCTEYNPCWRGICENKFNEEYQSNFTCKCSAGYNGQFCEKRLRASQRVCDLPETPCKNNGKCIQQSDDIFECECGVDFEGDLCENQKIINYAESEFNFLQHFWNYDCRFKSCKNNGTCTKSKNIISKLDNEHKCQCLSGFAGNFCELDINECLLGTINFF